eukprot:2646046-Alexandrium_andersonii.AAC.1
MPPQYWRPGRKRGARPISGDGGASASRPSSSSSSSQPSKLVEKGLELWAWGLLSAPALQCLCAAAEEDGLLHEDVSKAAALGSHGRHPQNCH